MLTIFFSRFLFGKVIYIYTFSKQTSNLKYASRLMFYVMFKIKCLAKKQAKIHGFVTAPLKLD